MISEEKKRIVVGNYFNVDCDIDTTIREAYELGFDRGMQKVSPVIRRDVLRQVLEIIDKYAKTPPNMDLTKWQDGWVCGVEFIRSEVEALKGGD